MKTIDQIYTDSPAGAFLDTDLVLIQRSGSSKADALSALKAYTNAGITVESDDITDATAVGIDVLTAAGATEARAVIGAAASSHTHTSADITDATAVGIDVLTAADAAGARAAIGAAESSHIHDYSSSVLEVGALKLSGTAPGTLEEGQFWYNDSDEVLEFRTGAETKTVQTVKTTSVVTSTANLSSDATHLGAIVAMSSDSSNLTYTLDLVTGASVGSTITLVNTGVDTNTVSVAEGDDVSFISSATLADGESCRLVCLETGATQKWFKG